jgi:hypothetical protein
MMALLPYIHMEAITIHQWLKCTLIFSIHPNEIITIFPFILHPSSFIIATMCVVIYSDLIISSFNLSVESTNFAGESSYLSMVLITKLPLLILWSLWRYFIILIFIYIIIFMDSSSLLIYGLWFLRINWFLYLKKLHLICNKLVWF